MEISSLSKKQLVGQMLCFAFLGTSFDEQLRAFVSEMEVGGIIYFARNIQSPAQVANLNQKLQQKSPLPLFIGIDQEGGMVQRLTEGLTPLPGAMTMAAALASASADTREKTIYEMTKTVGQNLKCLGFNVNFAPVGDINNNINNPVINSRSYGDDPNKVAQMVIPAFKGFQDSGILPTIKHFPGHGNTSVDSHIGLPRVFSSQEAVSKMELVPFKQAIKAGIDGVMISHIVYEAYDQIYPATLSQAIITDLLKKELAFSGLIVTDSLTMGAIHSSFDVDTVLTQAVNAGNDLLIFCGPANLSDQRLIFKRFLELVETGAISLTRVLESVTKIWQLKEKYITPFSPSAMQVNVALAESLYQRAVTKVLNHRCLPLKPQEEVLILFPEIKLASLVDNETTQYQTLSSYFSQTEIIYNFTLANHKTIIEAVEHYQKIILCTYNVRPDDFQVQLFASLPKDKTLVIAMRSPYDIHHLPGLKNYVCLYELSPQSLKACAQALRGEIPFNTKLPIKLDERS